MGHLFARRANRITDKTYQIVETGKKPQATTTLAKINQVLENGLIYKPGIGSRYPDRLEGLRAFALGAGVQYVKRIERLIQRQPRGHVSHLPDELMVMVLGHLGTRDLGNVSRVCTETRRLTADVWLTLAREFGYLGTDAAQAKAYMQSLDHSLHLLRPHLEIYLSEGSDLETSLRNLKSITAAEIFHLPESYTIEFTQFLCKILRDRKSAPQIDYVYTLNKRLTSRHPSYVDFHSEFPRYELLIRLGGNELDLHHCSIIDKAIKTECFPMLQICMECVPTIDKSCVLLNKAAAAGKSDVVRYLLEEGAKVNAVDNLTRTALHRAAENGHLAVCRILIDSGAVVDRVGFCGETPLHFASINGRSDVARLLLENGANVDARCHVFHETPLHKSRCKKVSQVLLEKGADLESH